MCVCGCGKNAAEWNMDRPDSGLFSLMFHVLVSSLRGFPFGESGLFENGPNTAPGSAARAEVCTHHSPTHQSPQGGSGKPSQKKANGLCFLTRIKI